MPKISPFAAPTGANGSPVLGHRDVYFRVRDELRPFSTTYYERSCLRASDTLHGPAIIFQVDSTTVVPPGWTLRVDPSGSLVLTRKRTARRMANGNR